MSLVHVRNSLVDRRYLVIRAQRLGKRYCICFICLRHASTIGVVESAVGAQEKGCFILDGSSLISNYFDGATYLKVKGHRIRVPLLLRLRMKPPICSIMAITRPLNVKYSSMTAVAKTCLLCKIPHITTFSALFKPRIFCDPALALVCWSRLLRLMVYGPPRKPHLRSFSPVV